MSPTIDESVVPLDCDGEPLVSILTRPVGVPCRSKAILIAVGGPQYRVGSHRQFALLARYLAGRGYAVLRFDCRGMGDSSGAARAFTDQEDDLRVASEALLRSVPGTSGFVVWGLCDGASAALMFPTKIERCVGLILVNPWVRSEVSLAKAHVKHYYRDRMLQGDFWRKAFSGRFEVFTAARAFFTNMKLATHTSKAGTEGETFVESMLARLSAYRGKVLCILSGRDIVAKEFGDLLETDARWRRAVQRAAFTLHRVDEADHTFSTAHWRATVEQICSEWLDSW